MCVGKQIVLAASYEAKAYGVGTGTPVREAKKLLPRDAVFCDVNFLLYGTISQQLVAFLRTLSPDVRPASIDEAFINLSGQANSEQGFADYASWLKHEIKAKIGIPVSIGIAHTKLLAKLGASSSKPFGSCALLEEKTIQELLVQTAVSKISFIGRKTAPKLQALCRHAEDFRQLDYFLVKQLL
ncbi:MAG: hypothetical protein H6765_01540 [Candidatus Peribacteria bacterium]|nr:MAG: hypothetical protein H6765_01540 [Candidatus Peribacteria bacterium]